MTFALVLSGGGRSGSAWQTGLLKGLQDGGVNLTTADLIVGTSAGAVVGAQIASGYDLNQLYEGHTQPSANSTAEPKVDLKQYQDAMGKVLADGGGRTLSGFTQEVRARIGALAVAAQTESEENQLRQYEAALPTKNWPERKLLITAVDAADGAFVVWSKESSVPLVKAVASSCAVPMVRAAVTINGRRYLDGGLRSTMNSDLAAGYDLVIAVVVSGQTPEALGKPGSEIASLREAGSRVELILPDKPSRDQIFPNLFDPARRVPSAQAGLAQGLALASTLKTALAGYWG
ncbi:MAG TPA: patatin-like phospholipase family protein [bacterium]|nr:patatin-like phospholipase family protein [bacterium]